MGSELAVLGTFPKSHKKNKVYYVNRLDFGFSVPSVDEKGNKRQRTNLATGLPITNGRGEPEYFEENVMFRRWQTKFSDLGYWCIFEVTPETPKHIAVEMARMAESRNHQVMTEEAFIEYTNPALAQHIKDTSDMEEEKKMLAEDIEKGKAEKSKLEKQIEELKKKAGVS